MTASGKTTLAFENTRRPMSVSESPPAGHITCLGRYEIDTRLLNEIGGRNAQARFVKLEIGSLLGEFLKAGNKPIGTRVLLHRMKDIPVQWDEMGNPVSYAAEFIVYCREEAARP